MAVALNINPSEPASHVTFQLLGVPGISDDLHYHGHTAFWLLVASPGHCICHMHGHLSDLNESHFRCQDAYVPKCVSSLVSLPPTAKTGIIYESMILLVDSRKD